MLKIFLHKAFHAQSFDIFPPKRIEKWKTQQKFEKLGKVFPTISLLDRKRMFQRFFYGRVIKTNRRKNVMTAVKNLHNMKTA